ncbi:hypothetical protein QN239_01105 [Mycolicibacterium sp. Y3]
MGIRDEEQAHGTTVTPALMRTLLETIAVSDGPRLGTAERTRDRGPSWAYQVSEGMAGAYAATP